MWSDTNGYRLNFNVACCGTGAALDEPEPRAPASRRAKPRPKCVENTTTWLKGNHNMQFGAAMVQADVWLANQTLVPTAEFDIIAERSRPTRSSTPRRLPGASAADITQAKSLYAMLTGRIFRLTGDARINAGGDAYNLLGASRAEGRMREFNIFVSDSWRVRPNLTVSARLALRAAESVLPDQRQLHDPDASSRSTASRASATSTCPAR